VSQKLVTAENLVKSQNEYMKAQSYVPVADYNPDDPANRYELIDIAADLVAGGYAIELNPPELITSDNVTIGDFELQSIEVIIKHREEQVLTSLCYRTGSAGP